MMTGVPDENMVPSDQSAGDQSSPAKETPPAGGSSRKVQKLDPVVAKTIKKTKLNDQTDEPEPQSPPADTAEPALPPSGKSQPAQQLVAQPQPAPQPDFMPPPPPADLVAQKRKPGKLNPVIARTKLDLDACKQVVGRMISDKEVKASEDAEFRSKEQPKPPQPIESYRRATPCASDWNAMSGTDRFRMCSQCKLYLYDFTNLELQEAKDIVYQREGNQVTSFYRRKDGKFLVKDCPAGVANAHRMIAIIATGVLLVGAAIASLCLMPPPPAPPAQPQVTEQAPPSGANPPSAPTQLPNAENLTLPAGRPSAGDAYSASQPDPSMSGAAPNDMHEQKVEKLPSAGESPSGRYVTVPLEVFESANQAKQTPAAQPAPNQPGGQAAPSQTPAQANPATPAEAIPAQAPSAVPVQQSSKEAETAPSSPQGNPYVKNY